MPRRLTQLLIGLVAWGTQVGWSLDPNYSMAQYGHTAWRVQDGFFPAPPTAIAQTNDGYLWVGTESGLLRFDGVRFFPLRVPGHDSFSTATVYSLLGSKDGALWIGTDRYLYKWRGGQLNTYDAAGRVNAIVEDREDTVWFTRSRVRDRPGPLCEIVGSITKCYGTLDGFPLGYADPLVQADDGFLWLGSTSYLVRWKPGSAQSYSSPPLKTQEGLAGISALLPNQNGSVWVGIRKPGIGLGLQVWRNGLFKPFTTSAIDGAQIGVSALFRDGDSVLVGTPDAGVYRIKNDRIDHFSRSNGLSGDLVSGFFKDKEGSLWVISSQGIDSFRDLPVITFGRDEGLNGSASSVLAGKDGTIWAGTETGLYRYQRNKFEPVASRNRLPGEEVTSLLVDGLGRLWFGVDNKLIVFDGKTFWIVNRLDGNPTGAIELLAEDHTRTVWAVGILGDRHAVYRIREDHIDSAQEVKVPAIPTMFSFDSGKTTWAGFRNGDVSAWMAHPSRTLHVRSSVVVAIAATDADFLVIATRSGVSISKRGSVRELKTQDGLPCEQVLAIIPDKCRKVWLYTKCGLIAIPEDELSAWWTYGRKLRLRILDSFDGVQPGSEPFRPNAAMSSDGRLWFVNENAVQMIDPTHLRENPVPPSVQIEDVVVDRVHYSSREELRLPPLSHDLEIDYTALSFVVPQRVRFRFKLEGRDADWQDTVDRRQAYYGNLPHGQYRFRVIACNNSGLWNEQGATLSFVILPTWYQRSWFPIFCIGIATALIWVAHRIRVRQVAAHIRGRLEERTAERERIARELHDTLLQSVQGLLLRFHGALDLIPEHEPSRDVLEETLDRAQRVIEEGRDRVSGLRLTSQEVVPLPRALLLVCKELAVDYSIPYQISVSGIERDLHSEILDELHRIGHESLINAFKHSQAKKIDVEIKYDRNNLSLIIRDDGRGIDPSVLEAGGARPGHFGLSGIKERGTKIGAKLDLSSHPGRGTQIHLTMSASTAYCRKSRRLAAKFRDIVVLPQKDKTLVRTWSKSTGFDKSR